MLFKASISFDIGYVWLVVTRVVRGEAKCVNYCKDPVSGTTQPNNLKKIMVAQNTLRYDIFSNKVQFTADHMNFILDPTPYNGIHYLNMADEWVA